MGERLAVEKLHGEELQRLAVGRLAGEELEYATDVWVRHPTGEQHFPTEPLHHTRVPSQSREDGLHRHTAAELAVPGFVDFSHSSTRDGAKHLEASRQALAHAQPRAVA